ncbi:MAG: hypothetical protein BECKG1743D_GA0114223_107464 [Candidatus Kentron sp. G]|nr:MAG: hypothetical protein BECKG1743F_GA0114225_107194 [Candidatus Kentron sp. G]VFN05630.1 MAG: hypothetical protein BECKG1743D_GA0114223_107464 [Candidatus Kentron sp. G]VFN06869.1 MAG: hypothetical protein BECKG1743E_GA0114224_110812 [Candidatus Kentron sp. G]
MAAHQQITAEWWYEQRDRFDLYASELVMREASAGDPEASTRRLDFLADLPRLTANEDVMNLSIALLDTKAIPQQAVEDAYHIAMATVHDMNFLLTWNFKHIANATMRGRIEQTCRAGGFEPPIIATPEQILEK